MGLQLVGGPGAGKTQACLQLSVSAALPYTAPPPAAAAASSTSSSGSSSLAGSSGSEPAAGGVLYIDTEGTFSAGRLVEIARARYPGTTHIRRLSVCLSALHLCLPHPLCV